MNWYYGPFTSIEQSTTGVILVQAPPEKGGPYMVLRKRDPVNLGYELLVSEIVNLDMAETLYRNAVKEAEAIKTYNNCVMALDDGPDLMQQLSCRVTMPEGSVLWDEGNEKLLTLEAATETTKLAIAGDIQLMDDVIQKLENSVRKLRKLINR